MDVLREAASALDTAQQRLAARKVYLAALANGEVPEGLDAALAMLGKTQDDLARDREVLRQAVELERQVTAGRDPELAKQVEQALHDYKWAEGEPARKEEERRINVERLFRSYLALSQVQQDGVAARRKLRGLQQANYELFGCSPPPPDSTRGLVPYEVPANLGHATPEKPGRVFPEVILPKVRPDGSVVYCGGDPNDPRDAVAEPAVAVTDTRPRKKHPPVPPRLDTPTILARARAAEEAERLAGLPPVNLADDDEPDDDLG